MEYYDIYLKRLNRYGTTFQERVQGQREAEFEDYLLKSVYRVEFEYDETDQVGSLERYKQDDTKTVQYLLTRLSLNMPGGTILAINDDTWMVWYLENIAASGYNRYIVLKMSHFLAYTAPDGSAQTTWAYMFGKRSATIRDQIKGTKTDTVYMEDSNCNFFVLPKTPYIKKDTYFTIGSGDFEEHYRVTGFDIQSTEGVEYVTIDPIYEFDQTPAPTKPTNDTSGEYFWFNGK